MVFYYEYICINIINTIFTLWTGPVRKPLDLKGMTSTL